jgi:hypothetical protein
MEYKMTKHTYKDNNLTGVVILGQYRGDIREALKRFRNPFENFQESTNKWVYCDHIMHNKTTPVGITVSYEKSHTQPEHILASALSITSSVDEKYLKGYLDDLLEATGIKELESKREQFEADPFNGWESVSRQI